MNLSLCLRYLSVNGRYSPSGGAASSSLVLFAQLRMIIIITMVIVKLGLSVVNRIVLVGVRGGAPYKVAKRDDGGRKGGGAPYKVAKRDDGGRKRGGGPRQSRKMRRWRAKRGWRTPPQSQNATISDGGCRSFHTRKGRSGSLRFVLKIAYSSIDCDNRSSKPSSITIASARVAVPPGENGAPFRSI